MPANKYEDIHFFQIGSDCEGFATFHSVYKRDRGCTRKCAVSEVRNADVLKSLEGWTEAKGHAPGGLDMRFPANAKGLVIMATPEVDSNGAGTYFKRNKASDLKVLRKGSKKAIRKSRRAKDLLGIHRILSFEMNLKRIKEELDGHAAPRETTRFPIMLDFVDTVDGLSPVYKEPHPHLVAQGDTEDKPYAILTHGGIHPRSASSTIIVGP